MSAADPYVAIADQLGGFLGRSHRWHQRVRPSGPGQPVLERPAYLLLARIHLEGPIRPSALADMVVLDLSTVSRHLASLERAGWITREPDPVDRRAHLVRATEEGTEVFESHRQRWHHLVREILNDWSEPDLRDFVRLLTRFNQAAEGHM